MSTWLRLLVGDNGKIGVNWSCWSKQDSMEISSYTYLCVVCILTCQSQEKSTIEVASL